MNTTMCITLPEELKIKINEYAKKKNISTNALIRLVLTEFLEKN